MRNDPARLVDIAIRRALVSNFGSDSFRDGLALIVRKPDRHPALLPGAHERLEDAAAGFQFDIHPDQFATDRDTIEAGGHRFVIRAVAPDQLDARHVELAALTTLLEQGQRENFSETMWLNARISHARKAIE